MSQETIWKVYGQKHFDEQRDHEEVVLGYPELGVIMIKPQLYIIRNNIIQEGDLWCYYADFRKLHPDFDINPPQTTSGGEER